MHALATDKFRSPRAGFAIFGDGGPVAVASVQESVWISDDNGFLLHTAGGGNTWCDAYPPVPSAARPDPNRSFEMLAFVSLEHGWALVRGHVLETRDGDRSWHQLPAPGTVK